MGLTQLKKLINFSEQVFSAKFPVVSYIGGWQGHHNLGGEKLIPRKTAHKKSVNTTADWRGDITSKAIEVPL
jgi:hypothetical protein